MTIILQSSFAPRTCIILRLLSHFSVAHVVPGALVDYSAPHERASVPLQLQLLTKQSVCAALGDGRRLGSGGRGAGELGTISDDEDCSS